MRARASADLGRFPGFALQANPTVNPNTAAARIVKTFIKTFIGSTRFGSSGGQIERRLEIRLGLLVKRTALNPLMRHGWVTLRDGQHGMLGRDRATFRVADAGSPVPGFL